MIDSIIKHFYPQGLGTRKQMAHVSIAFATFKIILLVITNYSTLIQL